MLIILKFGSLNLLEPSGPVQACNGIALPLLLCTSVLCNDLPHTHFFPFRLVTYCILEAQNIQYTLELLTEFFNCISYFNMKFKPFIVKNLVFLYLHICSQNFCNITIYPSFVMRLPEDGRKSGRNMYDEYCFCNIRYVHTFTCIFLVPLPYLRFEYFVERNRLLLFRNRKTIYQNPPWPAWGWLFHPIWFFDLWPGVRNVSY